MTCPPRLAHRRSSGPRGRSSALLASLLFVGGASCPTTPQDCARDSAERCLWEQGPTKPDSTDALEPNDGGEDQPDATIAAGEEMTELDQALSDMIEIVGAGLEWPLVDERARALCTKLGPPDADGASPTGDTDEAWSCPIFALDINGLPLDLEASHGVISLSAAPLDTDQSEALLDFALARFDDWCSGDFEELEGGNLEAFHRCALAKGPYLVIARFPRDLELDQWQVSIAVVDAG